MSEWLTIPSAAAHEADARAWWGEALAQRTARQQAEAERDAMIAAVREICPVEDSEEGDEPYICLGEDDEPIIQAETPADAIRGMSECWDFETDRANRLTSDLRGLTAALAELREEAGKMEDAISWACGESGSDFADQIPCTAVGKIGVYPRYWWRDVLRKKAGMIYDPERGRSFHVAAERVRGTA